MSLMSYLLRGEYLNETRLSWKKSPRETEKASNHTDQWRHSVALLCLIRLCAGRSFESDVNPLRSPWRLPKGTWAELILRESNSSAQVPHWLSPWEELPKIVHPEHPLFLALSWPGKVTAPPAHSVSHRGSLPCWCLEQKVVVLTHLCWRTSVNGHQKLMSFC